MFKSGYN